MIVQFDALLERLAVRTILTSVDGFGPYRRGVAIASLELNPPMFIHKALLGREREGGAEYFALHTDQTWGIMVIESDGP